MPTTGGASTAQGVSQPSDDGLPMTESPDRPGGALPPTEPGVAASEALLPRRTAGATVPTARVHRRAGWPTLTLTVLALLAVLAVLLLTGGGTGSAARFGVRADPAEISLTAGDSAPIVLRLSAEHGFHATVTLTTSTLPPGVQLDLDRRTVPIPAGLSEVRLTGRLRTSTSAAASTVGIEVIGRSGKATSASLIQLHIQAADPASPSVLPSRAHFTVSGTPRGTLRPGGSLPIDLRLVNANPFQLSIDSLTVAVAAVSKPGCQPADFVIVPYRGGYPLLVPAGTSSTLSSLRVPASRWPQLRMRPQAVRTGCQGATVQLRYGGTGSG
jgi:hypothetical protein